MSGEATASPLTSERASVTKRRPVTVVICSNDNQVRIEWAMGFKGMQHPMGRNITTMVIGGQSINDARNLAFEKAIEEGSEFLFMYDYDIVPRRQDVLSDMLSVMDLNKSISVLGGVYPLRDRAHPEPIVIAEEGGGVSWDWQDGQLHDVYMTGTGFTCFRLDDFVAIRDELPEYSYEGAAHDGRKGPTWLYCGLTSSGVLITDDGYLANVCKKHDLRWVVHGGVICDQIDIDGHLYKVEDAKPKTIAEKPLVTQEA